MQKKKLNLFEIIYFCVKIKNLLGIYLKIVLRKSLTYSKIYRCHFPLANKLLP